MFWVVWNAWNRAHRVLYLTHLRQLTLAAMRRKEVSPGEKSVRSGRIRWRRCGGRRAEPLFCDWANGRIRETQSFLLPHLQQGCVCHDPWGIRDLAPLSVDEALSTRSASSFRDSWLACAWFRRQRHERGRSWAPAGADLKGSTGG